MRIAVSAAAHSLAASLILAGCTATPPPLNEMPVREPGGECDASGVQDYIGRTVTEDIGAEILTATGSSVLRWGPPNSAMTMDYRLDRVTVAYDDDLVIERIVCG